MEFKIKIERKHIEQGTPGNTRQCAIALALKEFLAGQEEINGLRLTGVVDSFTGFEIREEGKHGGHVMFIHSPGVKSFIERFDRELDRREPKEVRFRIEDHQPGEEWQYGAVTLEGEEAPESAAKELPRLSNLPDPKPANHKEEQTNVQEDTTPAGSRRTAEHNGNQGAELRGDTAVLAVCIGAKSFLPELNRSRN